MGENGGSLPPLTSWSLLLFPLPFLGGARTSFSQALLPHPVPSQQAVGSHPGILRVQGGEALGCSLGNERGRLGRSQGTDG